MAKRRKVALIFSNNENWIGGTYYVLNLINALNSIPDSQKPLLIIFLNKSSDQVIVEQTGYPYLHFLDLLLPYRWWERIVNKISRQINGQSVILKKYPSEVAEAVFPYFIADSLRDIPQKLYWIPDLQAHVLPHFFTADELERLKALHSKLAQQAEPVVFSSRDARDTFQKFFPTAKCTTFVLNFAVTHPSYQHLNIDQLKAKYTIRHPYFISPNQFWKHKNHLIVLQAVEQLYKNYPNFQLVFTGKEFDNRAPLYTQELKEWVSARQLDERIKFLGFIDRQEQLQLMNHSLAVIQPSLFEGWSTVVEDSKAMNQYLLLSDLNVHREQIDYNVSFFDPYQPKQLADLMEQVITNSIHRQVRDYALQIKQFGTEFLSLLKDR